MVVVGVDKIEEVTKTPFKQVEPSGQAMQVVEFTG